MSAPGSNEGGTKEVVITIVARVPKDVTVTDVSGIDTRNIWIGGSDSESEILGCVVVEHNVEGDYWS